MLYGYQGKILWIDLSEKTVNKVDLSADDAYKYIGGSGLGAKILFSTTGAETDPLGPENTLIFMTGPFTGTRVPTAGRHAVVTKSPLTGIWAESDIGGTWGTALKKAGIDGLVIVGASNNPVYLWITDSTVEFRNAEHIWGKDTYEIEDIIRSETNHKAAITSIGPAGENLVKFASIMSDGKDGRAAGRSGVGAVMGAKKLKAIAVCGSQNTSVARPEELKKSITKFLPTLVANTKTRKEFGTSGALISSEKLGDLPIKNWREGSWVEGSERISGQRMAETILTGRFYCSSCMIGCGRKVEIKNSAYGNVDGAGPEYETLALLGALCLVDDLEAVAMANELCNRYGMDTISTGGVIAFAMECFEHGLITEEDTGGVSLQWGDAGAVIDMIHQIGQRKKLGKILAEGVKRAAAQIGGVAEEFALHVKGLEPPAHDPRAFNSLAVAYATSNRGACHLQGFTHPYEIAATIPELNYCKPFDRFAVRGKGELTANLQNIMSMCDSLKICKFAVVGGVTLTHMVEWLNLITGWEMTVADFLLTGERLFNLKRLYNVRCGITRKDDTLPPRLLSLKRGSGGAADNLPPLGEMLSEYYLYRGWDELGRPTQSKLEELDLVNI
ncbi:aldehyde ferredoxin oxidoreductase [Thermanaerosceptrum fracticalcis]|uniref:Aldehyde ferredoxin oxidoreductase n=1 Tax=Thermanaerosceptrum fracticalcis TaxID=1712410 RepID=A0A7G6E2N4_THEFR|nr:aldehyde ferredoxin oxidoreductase family protein [Thermanaerosceptrum fracticalcis]QNB46338.1 aldehyde ferredoxin oxidoreductase [Thermanaerosceptrum fracticalcis]